MCGFAGFIDVSLNRNQRELENTALAMGEAIAYRGPDAAQAWADPDQGITLVHRRLSIIDLSPAGNQPMASSCGRFIMVYNGEVYNAEDLRKELIALGRSEYRGHSDTEVILEGFAVWGIKETIQKLIGMFSLAVWDKSTKKISLVRDRLGIKPLYWSLQNGR
ncbi:MAG: asparagine synthetase B, partial [Alphaproteobacteria bacterium]|nr:asparagine synthetase B [Alphaproteobacteria bacterium]